MSFCACWEVIELYPTSKRQKGIVQCQSKIGRSKWFLEIRRFFWAREESHTEAGYHSLMATQKRKAACSLLFRVWEAYVRGMMQFNPVPSYRLAPVISPPLTLQPHQLLPGSAQVQILQPRRYRSTGYKRKDHGTLELLSGWPKIQATAPKTLYGKWHQDCPLKN